MFWVFISRFFNNNFFFFYFFFSNFLRFAFFYGRFVLFLLFTFRFFLILYFICYFLLIFSFCIKFSLSFNILFSWKSFWYSCFVNFKSLTYSCIALSFLCIVIWKFNNSFSSSTSTSSICSSMFFCFFQLILFMLKIQSRNLRWGIFFLRLQIQSSCYCHQLILFQNPRCHQHFLLWNYLQSTTFGYYQVVIENLHLLT